MNYLLLAFLSALLFGSSTPFGKFLLDDLGPFQLASCLYFGAALGMAPTLFTGNSQIRITDISSTNRWRLIGAIAFGGVIGPLLMLSGLQIAPAASVSMWLNLELVITAALGALVFQDHLGRNGWIGVFGTVVASVILSAGDSRIGLLALVLVAAASLSWGLDNHLTALIDDLSPSQNTFWKGIGAGSTNLLLAFAFEPFDARLSFVFFALVLGALSYGASLNLYILAAQNIGATRSQLIFASAPFFGVALSILFLGEALSGLQILAAVILIASLAVLFRDQHGHLHTHHEIRHKHSHRHDDDHHTHEHDPAEAVDDPAQEHDHWHVHQPTRHSHAHMPDLHHRHDH